MIDLAGLEIKPSPNYDERPEGVNPDVLVLHYTAGASARSSIRWLCDRQAKASAHFVVGRAGQVTELVAPGFRAWHAGRSSLEIDGVSRRNVNDFSIGIELANHGLLEPDGAGGFVWECGRRLYRYRQEAEPVEATLALPDGVLVSGHWEPYAETQFAALARLIEAIERRCPGVAGQLVGHEEIGRPVGRKIDPGPLFPWDRFARTLPRLSSTIA